MKQHGNYLYAVQPTEVRSASGARGVLIRTVDGEILFRVYHDCGHFTDYEIRHDDLSVTINADELAAFYKVGERDMLEQGPHVLGLRKFEV
jgi:hypothetical protein